jgi:hypothetical protein
LVTSFVSSPFIFCKNFYHQIFLLNFFFISKNAFYSLFLFHAITIWIQALASSRRIIFCLYLAFSNVAGFPELPSKPLFFVQNGDGWWICLSERFWTLYYELIAFIVNWLGRVLCYTGGCLITKVQLYTMEFHFIRCKSWNISLKFVVAGLIFHI